MITRRARIVLAALVASTLALAGCAVPGTEAPGVAAVYNGVSYDNAEVAEYENALVTLHVPASATRALTLLLLEDPIWEAAQSHGLTVTEEGRQFDAELWIAVNADTTPVTEEVRGIVQTARAIEFLLTVSEQSVEDFAEIVADISADVEASPRFGTFSLDAFAFTLSEAIEYYNGEAAGLGPARFTVFGRLDGFDPAGPAWIQGE